MTGHFCPDCQVCPACGRSAWCEGDRILRVPCEHRGYCGDCNLAECFECRQEAEMEMHRTGDYSPAADPLYRPEAEATDAAYWARPPLRFPGSPGYRKDEEEGA